MSDGTVYIDGPQTVAPNQEVAFEMYLDVSPALKDFKFNWEIDGVDAGIGRTMTTSFEEPGEHTIEVDYSFLISTHQQFGNGSRTHTVTVAPDLSVSGPSETTVGQSVVLTADTNMEYSTLEWFVGNSKVSDATNAQAIQQTFDTPGQNLVRAELTLPNGDTYQARHVVTVSEE